MKVAILIAGYLRSIDKTFVNLENNIFQSFPKKTKIHSYIYQSLDEQSQDRYFNPKNKNKINKVFKILKTKKIFTGKNKKLDSNKSLNKTKNYWYKFYKLFRFIKSTKIKYDLIIKLRADIIFDKKQIFNDGHHLLNKIIIPKKTLIDKSVLMNSKDPFVSDMYAYGSPENMGKYINFYSNIDKLAIRYGKKKTPETYLYHYLNDNSILYKKKKIEHSIVVSTCNTIAISGDSGAGKSTLANLLKKNYNNSFVLEGDRYHKWERKDKKWNYVTHLDPKANYIAKMENDILDLKLGKNIYQVDYDHSNGKFTNKKEIKAKKNLIVCGLHSINGVKENVYNLKIYMDTDEKLKREWKINRDVKIRKKKIDNVLDQIKKRKKDFKNYIDPQKKKSDLIVRFYINNNNKIALELLINKSHNINRIYYNLQNKKINFLKSNYNKDFIKISFLDYKKLKLYSNKTFTYNYDYYDYLIFVILNMHNE